MTKKTIWTALLVLAIASAAQAGEITGTIHFEGEAPTSKPIQMNADPKCAEINGDRKVYPQDISAGADGGLANVFVYVKNPPAGPYPPPAEPVQLAQEGCMYTPRVQGILIDQTLEVVNHDPTLHNVRALADKNRPFNLGQPPDTAPRKKTFKLVEPALKFRCDVHPWMSAYIFVMDHPFFGVSGADGHYAIPALPPGTYTLVAWHEKLGEQEAQITVGDGLSTTDFEFAAP